MRLEAARAARYNRTYVELKWLLPAISTWLCLGYNRTYVELKWCRG